MLLVLAWSYLGWDRSSGVTQRSSSLLGSLPSRTSPATDPYSQHDPDAYGTFASMAGTFGTDLT